MKKWEYRIVLDAELTRYGSEGWEAVNIIGLPDGGVFRVLMKRSVTEGQHFPDPTHWPKAPRDEAEDNAWRAYVAAMKRPTE